MAIRIDAFRLSFIWLEHFNGLLPSSKNPMSFLAQRSTYKSAFEKALAGTSRWTVPWPRARYIDRFWCSYLETGFRPLDRIDSERAWDHLAPVRQSFPVRVVPTDGTGKALAQRVTLEGFYYPHAIGFVMTFDIEDQLTLPDCVHRAAAIRHKSRFNVGQPPEFVSFDVFASRLIDQVRNNALGNNAPGGTPNPGVFSVATVVRGGGLGKSPPKPNSTIHRALEGLCTCSLNWGESDLHDLTKFKLGIGNSSPARLLYGLDRSRAVWFPDAIMATDTRLLSCYHRNLTRLSLQIESLLALAEIADNHLSSGTTMPVALEDLSRRAAILLGLLYGGTATYRSRSAPRHIDDSGRASVVNRVRKVWKLPELH